MLSACSKAWHVTAEAVGAFLDEAAFRLLLAFDVLTGRVPRQLEKRFWNRSAERPVMLHVYDFTNDRRLFSVLVWPPLEVDLEDALYHHLKRVDQVKQIISRGGAEVAWSLRFETDYLTFDPGREVWIGSDGFAYDARFK
jgi:hypothetical protein